MNYHAKVRFVKRATRFIIFHFEALCLPFVVSLQILELHKETRMKNYEV